MQQQGSAEGMRSRMPEAMLCTTPLVMTGGVSGLAAHPCHVCLLLRLSSVQVPAMPGGPESRVLDIMGDHISIVSLCPIEFLGVFSHS
jgi:hypothetical protein